MRLNTVAITSGLLTQVDLVELGARCGLLWRSGSTVLVGIGEGERVPLTLDGDRASIQALLDGLRGDDACAVPGSGPVGFAALPFDRSGQASVIVASIVLGATDGKRFLTAPQGVTPEQVEEQVREILAAEVEPMPTEIALELDRNATSWRDEVVLAARDHLAENPIRKAVLARKLVLRADSPFPVPTIVIDLADRFPTASVFAIDGFVRASPETLVGRSDRTVRAHPLAGTAGRDPDPEVDDEIVESLRASSKDRTEHKITIDWLLTELLPFCSYVDAEPDPSVVSLANVHHLGTLVEGVLSSPPASVLDLVHAVHPTPAVGGAPQDEALALIESTEGFDRERYAGPAGWFDADGNGEFAVSVRTAQVRGSEATIWAGVGVVAQSDPDSELLETQVKFVAMLGTFLADRL